MVVTPVGGAAVTTDYVVDTAGGLSHVVAEVRGGAVEALYVRTGGMLLSEIRGTTVRYPEAEGIGSVRSLLDGAGATTDTWRYTAFGEETARSGTNANPYQFAGERNVSSVGLYQNRARWLSTGAGAFVSVDPLLRETADPYGYANSDPAANADPTGLFGVAIPLIASTLNLKVRSQLTQNQNEWGGILELWCRNADAQFYVNNFPILGRPIQHLYNARHCGVRIRFDSKEGDGPPNHPVNIPDTLVHLSGFDQPYYKHFYPIGDVRGNIVAPPWEGPTSNTGNPSNIWVKETADWYIGFALGERQRRVLEKMQFLRDTRPLYDLFSGPNSNTFARLVIADVARVPEPINTPGWSARWK